MMCGDWVDGDLCVMKVGLNVLVRKINIEILRDKEWIFVGGRMSVFIFLS